jgi:hypothetical protein
MSVPAKNADQTSVTSRPSPAKRPPRRPNMTAMLGKVCGIVLLVATVGLASCQALWVETPGISLLTSWMG